MGRRQPAFAFVHFAVGWNNWYVGFPMAATKTTSTQTAPERSFNWLIAGVVAVGVIHFLTSFAPGVQTWGIDYWSEIPVWARLLFLLLLAATIIPGVSARLASAIERVAWPRWAGWGAAAISFAVFVALRSRGYAYGDGYSFRSYMIDGQFPEIGGHLALMAGDLVAHWIVYRVAVMPLGGSVELAYSIVSALAGVATLAAIVAIAKQMYPKDRGARWALVAAGCSSGMAVLWFGYVEAYSLVAAAMMWSLAFLIKERRGAAWGMWVVACACHLLAVAFLPVLIWASVGKRILPMLTRPKIMLLFLGSFVAWGVAAAIVTMIRSGIFVPILETANSTYTAFSLAHLLDVGNLLLFSAPLGVIGLIAWFASEQKSTTSTASMATSLLAVAAVSLWYFAFWVDPLLGAFRDWDLIGAFGIPCSLLGATLLIRASVGSSQRNSQWIVVGALAVIHTFAFVLVVQSETKAMERVDRMVQEDVHYSRDFHRGERLMSWSYALIHLLDERERAVVHLRNRSTWEPGDKGSWGNLGSVYWHLQQYDSAVVAFERSLEIDTNDTKVYEMLALSYSASQKWPEARQTIERLARMRELSPTELNLWAFSLITLGDIPRADSVIKVSLAVNPGQRDAYYYRAILAERVNDTVAALADYERAMTPYADIEEIYSRTVILYQARGQWADAERVAHGWKNQFPGSKQPDFFIGVSRIVMKDYAGARDALESSVRSGGATALTYFYLATAYRNLGDTDRAAAAARAAIGVDPELALPYLELIYLAADAGDHAAAVAATREYLKRAPYDSGMSYLQQFMEP